MHAIRFSGRGQFTSWGDVRDKQLRSRSRPTEAAVYESSNKYVGRAEGMEAPSAWADPPAAAQEPTAEQNLARYKRECLESGRPDSKCKFSSWERDVLTEDVKLDPTKDPGFRGLERRSPQRIAAGRSAIIATDLQAQRGYRADARSAGFRPPHAITPF